MRQNTVVINLQNNTVFHIDEVQLHVKLLSCLGKVFGKVNTRQLHASCCFIKMYNLYGIIFHSNYFFAQVKATITTLGYK